MLHVIFLICTIRSKAIALRRPFPVVSVSLGGIESPKAYSNKDVILYRAANFTPSALKTIDGESATKYIEDLVEIAMLVGLRLRIVLGRRGA